MEERPPDEMYAYGEVTRRGVTSVSVRDWLNALLTVTTRSDLDSRSWRYLHNTTLTPRHG